MAGVYIKGMEMPRDGTYRMGLVVKEGKITAGVVKEESFADKDIEWFDCVLVPNHGDLIDRDEAIKEICRDTFPNFSLAVQRIKSVSVIIPAENTQNDLEVVE